jgi:hypothetical protein
LAIAGGKSWADTFLPVDTIDLQKLNARAPGSWINSAFWPTEATLRAQAYKGDLSYEKTELVTVLQRVMKDECLPAANLVQTKATGIADMRGAGDCLLLHYKTSAGLDIRITDERKLCLMVTVPDQSKKPLSEVGQFVWRTAASVLKYPEMDGRGPQEPEIVAVGTAHGVHAPIAVRPLYVPRVTVRADDIGRSKVGAIEYGPASFQGEGWYTRVSWWSDGQSVLFNISKLTAQDYARLQTSPVQQEVPPRAFKSRIRG